MIGIEITFVDGSRNSYDPLRDKEDFVETENEYIVKAVYDYPLRKEDVVSWRFYDVCELCGYELHEEKGCCNYGCKNNKWDEQN